MNQLSQYKCIPCEGGVPALSADEAKTLLAETNGWTISTDNKSIHREFKFKGFYKTMAFVNAVAWIANQEGHHPDMEVGFNYCRIKFTTHAIDGLTKNDFICAAKIDGLGAEGN